MYLSLVSDANSKKIFGYNFSNILETKASLIALKIVIKNWVYKTEYLIHHSKRGLQNCGGGFLKILNKKSITSDMTESYDLYSNAIEERINGIPKQAFIINER